MSFGAYILTAIALVFIIEGLLYALFPDAVRKMFAAALTMPPSQLRLFGSVMAISGFCLIWFLKPFS